MEHNKWTNGVPLCWGCIYLHFLQLYDILRIAKPNECVNKYVYSCFALREMQAFQKCVSVAAVLRANQVPCELSKDCIREIREQE